MLCPPTFTHCPYFRRQGEHQRYPTPFIPRSNRISSSNGKTDKRALRRMALENVTTDKESRVLQPSQKINREHTTLPQDEKTVSTTQRPAPFAIDSFSVSLRTASDFHLTPPPPVYQRHSVPFEAALSPSTTQSLGSTSSISHASDEKTEVGSSVEKGHGYAWEGYEDDVLPEKAQGKYVRNLRHRVFSLYRRLFGIVFCTNLAIFIATVVRGGTNAQQLGQIVVANLFCAILMRQDYVVNAFFNVFCSVPTSCVMSPTCHLSHLTHEL